MRYFNIFKKRWKLLFCWGLFSLSILFSLLVIVIKPMTPQTYYPYSYSEKKIEKVQFPVYQYFKLSENNLKQIHLVLTDKSIFQNGNSINQYDYDIKVYDEDNTMYYSNHFHNYTLNYVDIEFNNIKTNKNMILEIGCESCNNVETPLKHSNDNNLYYIESSNNDKIIDFNIIYLVPNNSYYWCTLVGITISLLLYPLAKEDIENEK